MNEYKNVEFASKKKLCFQCGACAAVCPQSIIKMQRNEESGLVFPKIDINKCIFCKKCISICPMCNLEEPKDQFKNIAINAMKSKDVNIYNDSTSGGVVTTVLVDLFKNNKINKAILVDTLGIYAYAKICTTIDEVKTCCGSKYQPVAVNEVLSKLSSEDRVAIVGLPCHIKGVKNLIDICPKYKPIIQYKIGIICTIGRGMHSTTLNVKNYVNESEGKCGNIRYRHGEFPGVVSMVNHNKSKSLVSCKNFLSKGDFIYYPTGCMFCNDLYNVDADISVGDTWGLGYKKAALTIIRTEVGRQLIDNCTTDDMLEDIAVLSKHEALKTQRASYNFKIKNYSKRCNILKKYVIGTPINYEKIPPEAKAGWILIVATKLLYLNSRIFNSLIGLKIRKVIPNIFFKIYRKILLLCLEDERIK
ncbi:Coenzyme F420 hydrogenase/dehydrogenase, beta subunit C-terminal domain [Clostridium sp. CF011]|uniref:Coenzyme F420 hydrogenase/dehydrogenase, beta subunit C-terminal domain n=1 Tax=Clostridium sp. CF011 TaxID=2843318 RepID=UPI001C0D430A|nr:Coenzyme F420 hydrogenase/dehydrogenase, beta subunit C-terminal domain [Clostridium sp. CF011]MBU3093649.1 Coenzyme F420 hydrogenase/dehydrogenase, beta subunit C-terminal domain [Clostridium sp. CF011]WAG69345.1 Coenzyme F420 hydrogenase/dehydrogenase, beta subunit C-terminal domain [Clostridium sp. CF011]